MHLWQRPVPVTEDPSRTRWHVQSSTELLDTLSADLLALLFLHPKKRCLDVLADFSVPTSQYCNRLLKLTTSLMLALLSQTQRVLADVLFTSPA